MEKYCCKFAGISAKKTFTKTKTFTTCHMGSARDLESMITKALQWMKQVNHVNTKTHTHTIRANTIK